jgi:AraC-like DNA-binding protein
MDSTCFKVVFIQTLRAHIASGSESCKRGWLRAIFDRQIGAALRSVHENVKSPWTVRSLAAAAGMSRSAFASRFKELLGQTPHCGEGDLSDTENTPPEVREVEAEAVALLCCESLGLPGAEFCRGYIQAFIKTGGQRQAISERSAQRI